MSNSEESMDGSLPSDPYELVALLERNERVKDVCKSVRNLIDPNDGVYSVQRELSSAGIVGILINLLSSDEIDELVEICETLEAVCANIEGVSVRKRSGLETGFLETSFNPVQDDLQDVEGIRKLVSLLDHEHEGLREVVSQTLITCCSFNHANKVSYLGCLVHDVLERNYGRLEYINMILPDIEIKDDVAVLLDQVMLPSLKIIRDEDHPKDHPYIKDAIALLGQISEQRPASTSFLCDEGALEALVRIILHDVENRSKAVHAMWHLIRHNKAILNPSKGKLGCEGILLVEPLLSIIGFGKEPSTNVEEDADEDYSDEALLILKALAEQDHDVRDKVGDSLEKKSSCAIM